MSRLLLVTGSARPRSTSSAALRTARAVLGEDTAVVYDALMNLPAFRRDARQGRLPREVTALRNAIASADAVVFCTPEYAGKLPDCFRNLLHWTARGREIQRKPVAWINVGGAGHGLATDAALAAALRQMNAAILRSSGIRVPVADDAIGPDGLISDETTRGRLATALGRILADLRDASAGRGRRP